MNRFLRALATACLLALAALFPGAAGAAGGAFEIYAFQAGKADAFLLTTENHAVLIDAGEKGFGKEILEYLEDRDIEALDYMIITHFDKDHVGGAAKVINSVPVYHVLQSNCPTKSEVYEKYLKALRKADIEPVTVRSAYEFTLDGVRFVVDPPAREKYEKKWSNNSSLIVSIYNGDNSFLFAGDAETVRIAEFLDAGCGQYDLLKLPHHGQYDELMDALIDRVRPRYALITSSDEIPEAKTTLKSLESVGAEVFLTRVAPVRVTSDGTTITVKYTH